MTVVLQKFVQQELAETEEWLEVSAVADKLLAHLNLAETIEKLRAANRPRTSSAVIQAAFVVSAHQLGFRSEEENLFADSHRRLRPDYYLPIGNTGILLEVERGKTTTNNMDLLDFWKCHLCRHAQYLFLLVPQQLQHNETMRPKREFETVKSRLALFFVPGNYTNVRGLCLFGY